MRALSTVLVATLVAASAPAQPQLEPLEATLKRAQADQASAEAETARLEQIAGTARGEADRLRAEEAAAAQGIEAAEARITAADASFRLAAAHVAVQRQQLAREEQPVSSLLAGLAVMAQRPPLLALTDGESADGLVRVGVLLDSTLPAIRSRTRSLSAQLSRDETLEAAALSARAELVRSRQALQGRREQFAQLQQRALEQSITAGGEALSTGDVAIAAGEQVEQIQGQESGRRSARELASLLASEGPAPPRPFAAEGGQLRAPFAYVLPVDAPVVEGLGAVNDSGVRSRGLTFASARGSAVAAPADGTIRFSGPFRDYDGILIIDHGGGWMSLIVNISSQLKPGDQVRLGDPVGRALGPVALELSHDGQRFSPALIAGSSQTLSKGQKRG